jgi:hypothetical protein
MLTNAAQLLDNANMCSQNLPPPVPADPGRIRELAHRHGVDAIRWWPPNQRDVPQGDVLVEGLPLSLRQLRTDLERALGCRVAIYLADCLADETRARLRRETIDMTSASPPPQPSPAWGEGETRPASFTRRAGHGSRRNQRRLRRAPATRTTAARPSAGSVRSTRSVRQPNCEPSEP